ncbi:MAG TPA: NAD-dependent epimerase/dehydratase family protein [Candidatus Bathyarchaeia archaeon]|nr:NAD-dependent epimerase/dehydratase family protein [Candidatus Bathyarchaeia archaeon]
MKLLITGATGFLGSYILRELDKPVYKDKFSIEKINLLVRNREKAKNIKHNQFPINIIEGDITDEQAVKKAVEDVDTVIHVASLYKIWGRKKDFYNINVKGTEYLLNALQPGSTFILTSTIGVYGYSANKGKPTTEEVDPMKPFWHYQKSKKIQEDLARNICKLKNIKFVAIRPPMISGPGDESTKIFMENLEKRRLVLARGGKGIIPVAHPFDTAKAHLLALEKIDKIDGEAFHLASFHISFKEMVDAYADELGFKRIKTKVPYGLIYSLGWFLDLFPFKHNYTRFAIKFLGASDQLIMDKIVNKLGYKPEYTFEQTVKENVIWYNSMKH